MPSPARNAWRRLRTFQPWTRPAFRHFTPRRGSACGRPKIHQRLLLRSSTPQSLTLWPIRRSAFKLADIGLDVPECDQQSPEMLKAFQKSEIDKWWPLIRKADIKPE